MDKHPAIDYYSIENLLEIFENIVSKKGGAGIDGVTVEKFRAGINDNILLSSVKINSSKYRLTEYKAKLVSKGPGKYPRVISIPTIRDKVVLRAACDSLQATFFDSGTKKPHIYVKIIKEFMEKKLRDNKEIYFLRIDIMDFYPSINHSLLIDILKSSCIDSRTTELVQHAISTRTKGAIVTGIPQGLSISNILAGIYMIPFDKYSEKIVGEHNSLVVRYVDDILVVTESYSDALKLYGKIRNYLLRSRKLKCHPITESGKTSISDMKKGVDYLGYTFDSMGVSVRKTSYKKMFKTVFEVISSYKTHNNITRLVFELNLKITGCFFEGKNYGWMLFFLQTDNVRQLARLDKFVQKTLANYIENAPMSAIKTFVKTYNQLRYKGNSNKYIPNFSEFSIDQMIEFLNIFEEQTDKSKHNESYIKSKFWRSVKRKIKSLEEDVMEFFS